jgi:hypothetical protein
MTSEDGVGEGKSYILANSGKTHDGATDYYLYYLGYVSSVPVAYRTAYYYNGTTPITITFEKNWVTEESITQSTTKTREQTTTINASGTVTVGTEVEAGAIFAKATVSASISATVGGEWATAISTSDTFETAKTKAEGESESISATIGEKGEVPGTYRYALFGTTDIYCLYAVDPDTREVRSIEYVSCTRETSYAWGIDFDPAAIPTFGKTGGGDMLEIPEIDFTEVDAPTDIMEGPPEPPPPETKVTPITWSTGIERGTGPNCISSSGTDGEIGTNKDSAITWTFAVSDVELINNRGDGTYTDLRARFVYTVAENKGDYTVLRIDRTLTKSLASYRAKALKADGDVLTASHSGTIHGNVVDKVQYVRNVSYGLVRRLDLLVDGPNKGDDYLFYFDATLALEIIEDNT